jgi:hypothetical protein
MSGAIPPLPQYDLMVWCLEGNITIELREIWWKIMHLIHLSQDRDQCVGAFVNTVMNFRVP